MIWATEVCREKTRVLVKGSVRTYDSSQECDSIRREHLMNQMKQGGTAIFVLSSLAYRVFLFARDFLVYSEVRKNANNFR